MRGPALYAARRASVGPHHRLRIQPRGWDGLSLADDAPIARYHPLADRAISQALRRRADEIEAAFGEIAPTLQELAPRQFAPEFAQVAAETMRARLKLEIPHAALTASWTAPLDMRALHARCVLGTFCRLIERAFDRGLANLSDGEPADALICRWGFHAVDITPCADGRLSGVTDYILRVPSSIVAFRESYAGAMFDVDNAVRHWESVELRRWRDAWPNAADAPTRYLKIGVYHYSSVAPQHEGCAAHGSDETRAASALLERLNAFEQAVRALHGAPASVATLLVGVDTDTDAIRVHVPDASGRMDIRRHVDSGSLYDATSRLPRESAKEAIRDAVAACAGASADDLETEGMRWFCGYLLKNNIGQVEAVRDWHQGRYADAGHTERLIVVGDPVDDVQLRNLAFQAQMRTVEEGADDLDVGIRILRAHHAPHRLPVPVLVHIRFDPRIPGAFAAAGQHARRLAAAITARHGVLAAQGELVVAAVVRAADGSVLTPIDLTASQDDAPPEAHR
ncbi:Carboxysome structural peptide [Bradyrhizobium sp. ORS 278]|uniref:carboxysome shell carbonic anhydrase n=1 Tax=Bradyrhizobium sp. (strain ORS 278) TaxID=114615 RepID=UPI0001507E74|nr:carboxysome shell carbonic anhydrase [Bradyrhizobium sp. ORS 278]CAL76112.1 Carboxysome structural peptide [Bradyrhizobium sp. ORS 278]